MRKIRTLLDLFITFAKMGAVTFGGGLAMMPIMQKELIEKKRWMTEEELIDYYAIGQSTPGVVAINVSTFIGCKQMGTAGGVVATMGMVFPSLVVITLIARFLQSASDFPIAQKALRGINVSVAALLTSVVVKFSKKTVRNFLGAACMALSFALIFFLKVPSFAIILGSALIGVAIFFVSAKKRQESKDE